MLAYIPIPHSLGSLAFENPEVASDNPADADRCNAGPCFRPHVSIPHSKQTRFVLERALGEHKRLRENGRSAGLQHVVALSFSPGVTVEGLLLKAMPPDTQAFG